MLLKDFNRQLLIKAVDLYLALAYKEGNIRKSVREKIEKLHEDIPFNQILASDFFEKIYSDKERRKVQSYLLRLGNDKFPHMKLGIERVGDTEQFIFTVDTHDGQFDSLSHLPGYEQFLAIKEYNRKLKEQIERRLSEENLPTVFTSYPRDITSAPSNFTSSEKTILIVDDEAHIRDILEMTLQLNNYCNILKAKNGKEALKIINESSNHIDLCLLDLMMDEMSGFDVLRALQENGKLTFHIIILTGMPIESIKPYYRKSVTKIIHKPFDFEKLVEEINFILS